VVTGWLGFFLNFPRVRELIVEPCGRFVTIRESKTHVSKMSRTTVDASHRVSLVPPVEHPIQTTLRSAADNLQKNPTLSD
jgi:hypothetical protein